MPLISIFVPYGPGWKTQDFEWQMDLAKQTPKSFRFMSRPCILPKVRWAACSLLREWSHEQALAKCARRNQCSTQPLRHTCRGWRNSIDAELEISSTRNQYIIHSELRSEVLQCYSRKLTFSDDFGVRNSTMKRYPFLTSNERIP